MSFQNPTDVELETELEREAIVSSDLGDKADGVPCELWNFKVSHSQRVGAAALLGVYGKDVQADESFIKRALADELTAQQIAEVEAKRPQGELERFGQSGKFGWAA